MVAGSKRFLTTLFVSLACCISVVSMFTCPAFGQGKQLAEYQVKAAYLYQFAAFVQWPRTVPRNDSFAICIFGTDPFGTLLDEVLRGESIGSSRFVAKRIVRPQDAVPCRVLFIASTEETQVKQILTALEATAVLTVSDMPEFTARGGMIQFVPIGNRVRFEVNVMSAERAGLSFSSELLKLAVKVKGN